MKQLYGNQEENEAIQSYQSRFHQLENVRSKEMQKHGQLVTQLEKQYNISSKHEHDLLQMVGSLRAETCCLKARIEVLENQLKLSYNKQSALENVIDETRKEYHLKLGCKDSIIEYLKQKFNSISASEKNALKNLAKFEDQMEMLRKANALISKKLEESKYSDEKKTNEISRLQNLILISEEEISSQKASNQFLLKEATQIRQEIQEDQVATRITNGILQKILPSKIRIARLKVIRNHCLNRCQKVQAELKLGSIFARWKTAVYKTIADREMKKCSHACAKMMESRIEAVKMKNILIKMRQEIAVLRQSFVSQCEEQLKMYTAANTVLREFQTGLIQKEEKILDLSSQLEGRRTDEYDLQLTIGRSRKSEMKAQAVTKFMLKRLKQCVHNDLAARSFFIWKDFHRCKMMVEAAHELMLHNDELKCSILSNQSYKLALNRWKKVTPFQIFQVDQRRKLTQRAETTKL